jgi:glutaredoxin
VTTEITLLTQDDCAFCDQAKAVLRRVRADHPLTIAEVDLASADGQHLALATGVLFAPGVLIDGKPFSHGRLSERRLRKALDAIDALDRK